MIGHKQLVERRRSIESFRDKISRLEKENKALKDHSEMLKAHIGELQKVIESFQDMEDRISLALLRRKK